MSLRTRLLIGYGYLVLLVVAVAGTATAGFFDLGGRIGDILEENVQSLDATTQLTEALERQNSMTLSALADEGPESVQFGESEKVFRAALADARAASASETEQKILDQIERQYGAYREARQRLLSEDRRRPLAAYREAVGPEFRHVKDDVQRLLEHNQQAIVEADRLSEQRATRDGVAMAALVGVGLLSFLVLTRALQRRLLDRLSEFRAVAEAVGSGNLHRRVSVSIRDELGVVAEQFNEALDRYADLERHVDGRISEMKQNLLGMFDSFGVDGALFNVDGRLVASTVEFGSDQFPEQVRERIVEAGRGLVEGRDEDGTDRASSTTVELEDGTEVIVELVYARGHRLVGWLARLNSGRIEDPGV